MCFVGCFVDPVAVVVVDGVPWLVEFSAAAAVAASSQVAFVVSCSGAEAWWAWVGESVLAAVCCEGDLVSVDWGWFSEFCHGHVILHLVPMMIAAARLGVPCSTRAWYSLCITFMMCDALAACWSMSVMSWRSGSGGGSRGSSSLLIALQLLFDCFHCGE